ncbi:MAG: M20 family metallopeptidase [Acidimicrobiia bacterium]|nr:M20 family metallopeptidase [Acidimicrobiia bacterium]MYC43993.1 M20 family metallopeptidase [Acidimicrobiia bacterium]
MTTAVQDFDEGTVERVLRPLLETPSEQTDLFEDDPQIREFLRAVVAAQLEELGLDTVTDGAGNVICEIGGGDAPGLVLFCYAMTHPAGRMVDPFTASRIVGADGATRLRGRGASEQMGALAAAVLTAGTLAERAADLAGPLVLCVSPAGETGRHDTARSFLAGYEERISPAACIVGIGTDNAICVANKGRVDATIKVAGLAGHSSMPWRTKNAIEGAHLVLRCLDGIALAGDHPHLGRPTLTPTAVHSSPNATHTVPDLVEVTVDRRLLPGDDPEVALADIRRAVEEIDGWDIDVEPGPLMYPSEVAPDSPFVDTLRTAFAAAGHPDPPLTYSHGCIDAGLFSSRGIPAVMLGAGEQEMWHTIDESVALDAVALSAQVYTAVALDLLTRPTS